MSEEKLSTGEPRPIQVDFNSPDALVIFRAMGRRGGAARARKLSRERIREIGVLGGIARAKRLSSQRRSEIAALASKSRWAKRKKEKGDC